VLYILGHFSIINDNIYYHVLYHKDVESAYIASKLLQKSSFGKTRRCDKVIWRFVDNIEEERRIINILEDGFRNLMISLDTRPRIVGLISVIDNKMRIRIGRRQVEIRDNRSVRRGRELSSLQKIQLASICAIMSIASLGVSGVYDNSGDIIRRILGYRERPGDVFGYREHADVFDDTTKEFVDQYTVLELVKYIDIWIVENGSYIMI